MTVCVLCSQRPVDTGRRVCVRCRYRGRRGWYQVNYQKIKTRQLLPPLRPLSPLYLELHRRRVEHAGLFAQQDEE